MVSFGGPARSTIKTRCPARGEMQRGCGSCDTSADNDHIPSFFPKVGCRRGLVEAPAHGSIHYSTVTDTEVPLVSMS